MPAHLDGVVHLCIFLQHDERACEAYGVHAVFLCSFLQP